MGSNPPSDAEGPQRVSGLMTVRLAHDLRELLGIMAHCTESLRQRFASVDADDPDLVELEGAIDSAFSISRDLTAVARPRTIGAPVVDLNELVAQARGVLQRVIGPAIELVFRFGAVAPVIEGDAVQLEWVLFHLCANGRDAMPDGGTLTIETSLPDVASAGGRYVRLAVSDTGRGIADGARMRGVEPFFTTQDGRDGLGLTSVAMIVRTFKGWLHIERLNGVGTKVEIYLPLLQRRSS
jgi:two-component system, cell cycle sensor histidine kinase and response regulator CckA